MSRDIETRLDDAWSQVTRNASSDVVSAEAPEVMNLIAVARELQLLAPTPQVRLAEGRRKFLDQAARAIEARRPFERAMRHPARAFGLAGVVVLLVLGVLMIAQMSPFVVQVPETNSSTLTMSPTYMTSPTRTIAVPINLAPSAPTLAARLNDSPQPKPVPTPLALRD
jgi:hypothetical protein